MKNYTTISINKLHPFDENPYKVLDNEEMNNLIASIQQQGIMTPLIIRPIENREDYEIISGHRRFRAAQKAGLTEVPAFIYAVSRDEAAIMLVDSNLHREHILPSEKAFAYKLKMEALSHQGISLDTTCAQVGHKSRDIIAYDAETSRETVRRYIRLTNLIPDILDLVDEGRIAFTPAVELSYLTEREQSDLYETMLSEDATPSLSQAQQMKRLSKAGLLDMDKIFDIMTEVKGNQKEYIKIQIDERYSRYIGKFHTPKETEAFIKDAIDFYVAYLDRRRRLERERDER